MTDNLYETYIANQASLTSFEKTALKVLVQNEVSNSSAKAFKITPPVSNNSGYSFGPLQFDLKNSSNATTFTGALTASGLFSEGEADALATRLAGKKGYANSICSAIARRPRSTKRCPRRKERRFSSRGRSKRSGTGSTTSTTSSRTHAPTSSRCSRTTR